MNKVVTLSVLITITMMQCSPSQEDMDSNYQHTNHLIHESSPYLLQHAHNPVDWYPWGEGALRKAHEEDKMLVISIGYAACHWCHVMEHESFEDSTVAAVMNEYFVSIKVDREERPDIDDVYMSACQLASGRGCGWPLNAFALPDGRPVWAGTYFPKQEWLKVLEYFVGLKQDEPQKLEEYADQLVRGIQQNNELEFHGGETSFDATTLDEIATTFVNSIDKQRGGRSGAPKFPMPNNYAFLMRYAHIKQDVAAEQAVTVTLDNMARGGIYDQLGGGFARYSVDAKWHIPHFEKMLYDNGQLVSLYAHAYAWKKDPLYERVVRETLSFVERELTDSSGGFYSSLDADSEGVEGKFYVWTEPEVDQALADFEQTDIIKAYFDITGPGNWEHGLNVLQITETDAEFARRNDLTESQLREIVGAARTILFDKRAERVRPGLDDKVLTSWNALMLKGYLDAYAALGDTHFLETALRNANFLRANMFRPDGGLNRNYKDGKSSINAFLDDYALLMEAWIALYQATFDEKWLQEANEFSVYVREHFLDEESGMFFYTSDLDPPLVARNKEINDNVIPASNSIMAKALHKLGHYFYDDSLLTMSADMLARIAPGMEQAQQPSFYSNWCDLYADHVWPLYEVAIVGDGYQSVQTEMMRRYLPEAIFLGGAEEGSLELLANKLQEGATYIYVCQNKVCKFPVREVDEAVALMKG